MQTIFTRKAPVQRCKDVFAICDLSGFAQLAESVPTSDYNRSATTSGRTWSGNKDYDVSLEQVKSGDLSGVAASDEILDKIEADIPLTQAWRIRDDVVGGVPNVPAFLAGHPLTMRRRERVLNEQGPLTIFANLELSAEIDVQTMRKRGAAVLALVRLLSNSRPVELYACCGVGGSGFGAHVLIKIDTAPLDLARAAHVLTDPSVTRGLCYAACGHLSRRELEKEWHGSWAYSSVDNYRRTVRDNYKSAINPSHDALLLPAAHVNDPCVKEPVKWLHDMLKQYGGLSGEE